MKLLQKCTHVCPRGDIEIKNLQNKSTNMFTKKNQMITCISNPHSKTSKSQTKLKETNLFNVVLFNSTYSKTCN